MESIEENQIPPAAEVTADIDSAHAQPPTPLKIVPDIAGDVSVDNNDENEAESAPTSPESMERDGVTFDGERFHVPIPTTSMTVSSMFSPSQWGPMQRIVGIICTIHLFFYLWGILPRYAYMMMFVLYRLCYNAGLGWLLKKQSEEQYFTKFFENMCEKHEMLRIFWKATLKSDMGANYSFDDMPMAYNAWLVFRYLAEVVLALDLATYILFCLSYWNWPVAMDAVDVGLYAIGAVLIVITFWAKGDAHRVVKDYAWYWGDFFFLKDANLTFDGVFEMFPHPMYTVGYSFYYGAALITQSDIVFYISLFGHLCQMAFLVWVENPHIEKTYGVQSAASADEQHKEVIDNYFWRPLVLIHNFDMFRAADMHLVILLMYTVVLHVIRAPLWVFVVHAIAWRLFLNVGLGLLLHYQSMTSFYTRHFESRGQTTKDALDSWKATYNTGITMAHVTFLSVAIEVYRTAPDLFLLRAVLGCVLLGIHAYSSFGAFETLGEFGWFYGDFFVHNYKHELQYTGIYRFLNNPDSLMGFMGYYGVALLVSNWMVLVLAIFAQTTNYLFVQLVEVPHMRKLYNVREDVAIEIAIKENLIKALKGDVKSKVKRRIDELKHDINALKQKLLKKLD